MLDDLVRGADVLVENFLPATLAKLGLEPVRLAELNPALVSCSISGYGRTGSQADLPGYDLAIQATAGLMAITGEPGGRPMKVGVAISDVIAGLYAAVSVLAGLHAQRQDGKGRAFDLALADCTLASLVNVAQSALVTGKPPRRYGNAHPNIVPYEVFATRDGHLVLAVGNDRQWQRFCSAVGRDDWESDPRWATNPGRVEHREQLVPQLERLFAERTTGAWGRLLGEAGVPHAPVLGVDEVFEQPQVAARGMLVEASDRQGRRYRLLGSPVHWVGEPPRAVRCPPDLGEHTDEVLEEWLEYDAARIEQLRRKGAIA